MEFIIDTKKKSIIPQFAKAIDLVADAREARGHIAQPVVIIMNAPMFNQICSEHKSFYQPGVFRYDDKGNHYLFGAYIIILSIVNKNEIVII